MIDTIIGQHFACYICLCFCGKVQYGQFIWMNFRSSQPELFLQKGVLKISSRFTGEHQWQSSVSKCKATLLKSHFAMRAVL